MKEVGFQGDSLISWHKKIHFHPISDPDYARENLVSLAETLVLVYFYYVCLILFLHYLVLLGQIESQTIPWLLIEVNTQNIFFRLPSYFINDKLTVFAALVTTVYATISVKYAFALIKADMHPGKNGKHRTEAKQVSANLKRKSKQVLKTKSNKPKIKVTK